MNIVIIFLIVVVLLLLYFLFTRYTSAYTLVSSPIFLRKGVTTIGHTYIKNPANKTSSYSIWVYLNKKVTNASKGTIFKLNTSSTICTYVNTTDTSTIDTTNGVFALYINANNNLIFTDKTNAFTIMTNFPLQKWTNIFINIYELEYYECYINGKLVNTFKTSSVQLPTTTSTIALGDSNNEDIIVTKLVRQLNTLDALSVWNNYLKGNGMASSTFNASLSISDKEEVIKNYSLFTQS